MCTGISEEGEAGLRGAVREYGGIVLNILPVQPEEVLYIGDSASDIRTARESNVPVLSAAYGLKLHCGITGQAGTPFQFSS